MSRRLSLRAHLLVGAALWTVGLFGLAIVMWHVLLGNRQPPMLMHVLFGHAHLVAIVCVACLLGGLNQVRRGWRPINLLRSRLAGLRESRERRLEGEYPTEIQPLVGDLNALLNQREEMVNRARAKAGDLAHGLKTPLAVLAHEAERAATQGHAELAATILQQVDRMRRQVDYQLAQARVASGHSASSAPVVVQTSAEALARTLARLHAERGLQIAVEVAPELQVRVDREDLDEMLGNLLDNACKWARSRCRIAARRNGDQIAMTVEDDGPGIDVSLRSVVLKRGVRADESAPGTGLGLSIVRDLADAYDGGLTLDDSPLGGLRVTLELPAV